MPIDYKKYPPNWKTEIRPRIMWRAGEMRDEHGTITEHACCERCGVSNYAVGYRDATGKFQPAFGSILYNLAGQGISHPSLKPIGYREARLIAKFHNEISNTEKCIVVCITVAHLDHNMQHNTDDNLKALCNHCHLTYDAQHHSQNARRTIERKKGLQRLFEV